MVAKNDEITCLIWDRRPISIKCKQTYQTFSPSSSGRSSDTNEQSNLVSSENMTKRTKSKMSCHTKMWLFTWQNFPAQEMGDFSRMRDFVRWWEIYQRKWEIFSQWEIFHEWEIMSGDERFITVTISQTVTFHYDLSKWLFVTICQVTWLLRKFVTWFRESNVMNYLLTGHVTTF